MTQAELDRLYADAKARITEVNAVQQAARKEALAVGVPWPTQGAATAVREDVAFEALEAANAGVESARVALEQADTGLTTALAAFGSAVDEKVRFIEGRTAYWQAGYAEATRPREPFEVDEGYDFNKLSPEVQKRLTAVLEWLELYRVGVIDKLLDPARNLREWGGGGLHMYNLRQIHPYTVTYAVLLDELGNREWHAELVRVAKGMLALATTEYRPGYAPKFAGAEGKGVRRFIYQPHAQNPLDPLSTTGKSLLNSGVLTDGHDLDKDLSDGTVVDLLAALHPNRDLDAETRAVYADLKDFAFGLFERRAAFTALFYPRLEDDPYFWSKPLNHPTVAFACAAGHMHRMFGGDALKAAYDRAVAELEADREYVQTPRGELYATPHGVQEGYKRDQAYRGLPVVGEHDFLQDNTYVGEAVAYLEVANRAGLGVAPDRLMSALGRSLDLCVMFDGYASRQIAGSVGGGGRPASPEFVRGRQVNLRTGESYPCRWREPAAGFREAMHQFTRNLTSLPMSRVMTPEIEAGLRTVLANAEREGYSRFGPRLALLLAVSERS